MTVSYPFPGTRVITQSGAGTSEVIPLNYRARHYECSLVGDVTSGSANWTVELTAENVYDPSFDASSAEWQDHSYLAGITTSDKGHIDFPVPGLRLVNAGTGDIRLTVIETHL